MGEAANSGIDICLACCDETVNENHEYDDDFIVEIGDDHYDYPDDEESINLGSESAEIAFASVDDEDDNWFYFDADDEPDDEAVHESSDDGITERIIERYHVGKNKEEKENKNDKKEEEKENKNDKKRKRK